MPNRPSVEQDSPCRIGRVKDACYKAFLDDEGWEQPSILVSRSPPTKAAATRPRQHSKQATMGIFRNSASSSTPYKDETPLPDSVPKVQELGATSAPLKSAAFFIGAYCKEYNGASVVAARVCRDVLNGL